MTLCCCYPNNNYVLDKVVFPKNAPFTLFQKKQSFLKIAAIALSAIALFAVVALSIYPFPFWVHTLAKVMVTLSAVFVWDLLMLKRNSQKAVENWIDYHQEKYVDTLVKALGNSDRLDRVKGAMSELFANQDKGASSWAKSLAIEFSFEPQLLAAVCARSFDFTIRKFLSTVDIADITADDLSLICTYFTSKSMFPSLLRSIAADKKLEEVASWLIEYCEEKQEMQTVFTAACKRFPDVVTKAFLAKTQPWTKEDTMRLCAHLNCKKGFHEWIIAHLTRGLLIKNKYPQIAEAVLKNFQPKNISSVFSWTFLLRFYPF